MNQLINLLHEGNYSCVIQNGTDVRTFTRRGGSIFEKKAHRRLERYVTGVLWGEAFKKNKYFTSDDEAQKFREALLEKDKDSEDISN